MYVGTVVVLRKLTMFRMGPCNSRDDSRFVPSQRETALLCNKVSHWLCASLKSALNSDYSYQCLWCFDNLENSFMGDGKVWIMTDIFVTFERFLSLNYFWSICMDRYQNIMISVLIAILMRWGAKIIEIWETYGTNMTRWIHQVSAFGNCQLVLKIKEIWSLIRQYFVWHSSWLPGLIVAEWCQMVSDIFVNP